MLAALKFKGQTLYEGFFRHLLAKLFHSIPGKNLLLKQVRAHWRLPEWACRWLRFSGSFETTVENKQLLLSSEGEHIENVIFWRGLLGGWEKISLGVWMKLTSDADYILDIGANTGIYALVAKSINPKAKVYGFEPLARIYQKFQNNCRLNSFDIQCYQAAVSNQDGTATIYNPTGHVYSATLDKKHNFPALKVLETTVKTIRLQSFFEQEHIKKNCLIKLDIEGHEPEALEGMGELLSQLRPNLLVEITSEDCASRVEKFLAGLDYLYFDIDEINPPKALAKLRKSSKWNILACQKPAAIKLGIVN